MAPAAGYKFWQRMASSFAKQLTQENHVFEASQYLIAVGKVK